MMGLTEEVKIWVYIYLGLSSGISFRIWLEFSGAFGKVQGGMPVASSSYPVGEPGFSSPMQFNGSSGHEGGSSNISADANKVVLVPTVNEQICCH